jgi:hypothetical protein
MIYFLVGFLLGRELSRRADVLRGSNRFMALLNVWRDRPTMYKMRLVRPEPPPLLHLAPDLKDALIAETHFDGTDPGVTAVRIDTKKNPFLR